MTLTQHHPRNFGDFRYVYPVVSRRSAGVSIGINLNPTGQCTFACIYCQVLAESPEFPKGELLFQKRAAAEESVDITCRAENIDLTRLDFELRDVVRGTLNGSLYAIPPFSQAAEHYRRLSDIAFSGDGEPTLSASFPQAVRIAVAVREELCPESTKLVLITNATRLQEPGVRPALDELLRAHGEVWAKLDAGTEAYYRQVARSRIPFQRVLENILAFSREHPIIIQSCLFSWHGKTMPSEEFSAYIERLRAIRRQGGRIARVQLYTIARHTPDPSVTALPDAELERFADQARRALDLPVETYFSR